MNPLLLHVLDLLAKSAGIVLLAFATLRLWRSASAAQRCAVWLAAFFALLLLPFTLLWQPLWSFDFAQPTAQTPLPQLSPVLVHSVGEFAAAPAAAPQSWLPTLSAAQWAALAWLAGFLCLLAHRAIGSLQLRRLRSESHPLDDERALACAARVAAALGVERGISLRTTPCVSVPLTWGSLQPVLLLPDHALKWDEASLESALRHEMGHIRHLDALTRLVATFITAFYWPNPLVWLAAKAWRTVQEQAADDLVMSSGAVAENYALQLLEAARGVQAAGGLRAPAAMAMAQPSTLETRLSAIMDATRNRSSFSMRAALTGFALSLGLLTLCATAQLRGADEKTDAKSAPVGNPVMAKARSLIVPKLTVRDSSLADAIAYLRQQSVALDPQRTGLNIVIIKPEQDKGAMITLDLTNVPMSEALHYVASLSNRVVQYEPTAVLISPIPAPGAVGALTFTSPDLPNGTTGTLDLNGATGTLNLTGPGAEKGKMEGLTLTLADQGKMVTRSFKLPAGAAAKIGNPRTWLTQQGVAFADGASAALTPDGSQLLARNTQLELQNVSALVEALAAGRAVAPAAPGPAVAQPSPLEAKAAAIILPTVQFQGASVAEALEFLRVKARQFDPEKKGVNIMIRAEEVPQNLQISLDLKNVPLIEALRYTTELAGLDLVAEPYAFILKPKAAK